MHRLWSVRLLYSGNWTICFAMQNVLTQAECGFNRKLGTKISWTYTENHRTVEAEGSLWRSASLGSPFKAGSMGADCPGPCPVSFWKPPVPWCWRRCRCCWKAAVIFRKPWQLGLETANVLKNDEEGLRNCWPWSLNSVLSKASWKAFPGTWRTRRWLVSGGRDLPGPNCAWPTWWLPRMKWLSLQLRVEQWMSLNLDFKQVLRSLL